MMCSDVMLNMIKLTEEILQEKSRQELINKSKSGANYKSKERANQNRWDRRTKSRIFNSVRDYNDINMDALFKTDILEFVVKVHGETNDYKVTLIFEDIMRNLQQEVKANKNKLEFRCILQALLRSFNSGNIYVSCDCPDWRYRFAHHAVENGYSSGMIELRPNRFDWTNKQDDMGSACKHVNLVIANLDWMMKIASVIYNYIKWCQVNMQLNYADYIFPQVYGVPYNKAVQLSLFDDPNDNGLLPKDVATINKETGEYEFDSSERQNKLSDIINKQAMSGRDEKGIFKQGNEYRFQKKEPKTQNSQEDENPLGLKFSKPTSQKDEENKSVDDLNLKYEKEEENKRL